MTFRLSAIGGQGTTSTSSFTNFIIKVHKIYCIGHWTNKISCLELLRFFLILIYNIFHFENIACVSRYFGALVIRIPQFLAFRSYFIKADNTHPRLFTYVFYFDLLEKGT